MTSCDMPQQRLLGKSLLGQVIVTGVLLAPETTAPPEDPTSGIDQAVVSEEAPAVNLGTEGEAPATGKGPFVEVVVGDSGALVAPVDEEQQ